MIVRVVKMSFIPDKAEEFLSLFEQTKNSIRNYEGCQHLSLLRDIKDETVFFTYSIWDDEEHLNRYRQSELFNEMWTKTKLLFNQRPDAWSTQLFADL